MKTLPTKPFNLANAQVKVACLQIDSLFSEVDIEPALSVPDLPPGIGPADAADALRKAWQVPTGPLPNLIALVESAGIPVILLNSFHDKHSATSHRGRWVKWIIALNANHAASRRRFSLAHDLGHIAFGHEPHNAIGEDGGPERLEVEANEFAVGLLFPRDDGMRELRGVDFKRLVALKQWWKVSVAFLIQQAYALGMINDSKRQSFHIQLSSLPGGRRREPGEFEPEEPTLIRRIVQSLQDDGMSIGEITDFGASLPPQLINLTSDQGVAIGRRRYSARRGVNLSAFEHGGGVRRQVSWANALRARGGASAKSLHVSSATSLTRHASSVYTPRRWACRLIGSDSKCRHPGGVRVRGFVWFVGPVGALGSWC